MKPIWFNDKCVKYYLIQNWILIFRVIKSKKMLFENVYAKVYVMKIYYWYYLKQAQTNIVKKVKVEKNKNPTPKIK